MSLRIKHDLKDLQEEQVLVLEDRSVLDEQGEEVLVDPELRRAEVEAFNRDMRENIHKYASAGHYQIRHGQTTLAERILPHYNPRTSEKQGFVLGSGVKLESVEKTGGNQIALQTKNVVADSYQSVQGTKFRLRERVQPKRTVDVASLLQAQIAEEEQLEEAKKPRGLNSAARYSEAVSKARNKIRLGEIQSEELRLQKLMEVKKQGLALPGVQEYLREPQLPAQGISFSVLRGLPVAGAIQAERQRNVSVSLHQAQYGTQSIISTALPSERLRRAMEELPNEQKPDAPSEPVSSERLQELRAEVGFMREEGYGQGLATLLQSLPRQEFQEEQVGRAGDQKGASLKDRIRLQYRDNRGNLMTPKEAFRYMSYQFHGQGPSHRKIEKRKLQRAREARTRGVEAGGSGLMAALRVHQEKSGQAHLQLKRE